MQMLTEYNFTATEKKAVIAIIKQCDVTDIAMTYKIGSFGYTISQHDSIYTVVITKRDRGLGFIGSEIRESKYTYRFTI